MPACIKLLFDCDYESLVQWQEEDFQAFTEEVHESLGGSLKKYIREYDWAFHDLHSQPSFGKIDSAATGANSALHKEDGEESNDNISLKGEADASNERYLRERGKACPKQQVTPNWGRERKVLRVDRDEGAIETENGEGIGCVCEGKGCSGEHKGSIAQNRGA